MSVRHAETAAIRGASPPGAHEEHCVAFSCQASRLHGVLAMPVGAAQALGVVIVVGGPQYRVGSHRQFVLLARRLADEGYPCLRFDQRGMGDSEGESRSFEAIGDDIAAAVDALVSASGVERVALWGLCDGASAILLHLARAVDARIAGACLLNPWVRTPETLARTHIEHHYGQRLRDADFWRRLVTGHVGREAVTDLWRNLRLSLAPRRTGDDMTGGRFQDRMARGWNSFEGSILLLLSEVDYTAREFLVALETDPVWRGAGQRAGLERHDLPGADHTLSRTESRHFAEWLIVGWLRRLGGNRSASERST